MTAQDTIAEQLEAVNIEIDSITTKLQRLYDEERAWRLRNKGVYLRSCLDEMSQLEDRWVHLENHKITLHDALEI